MLIKPMLDDLLPKVDSRYTLAMLVAKRTRQLVDGAQPLVEEDTPNLVTLACEEVEKSKVVCVEGNHQPFVPIRPEIEEARRLAAEQAALAELEALKEASDLAQEARILAEEKVEAIAGIFLSEPDAAEESERVVVEETESVEIVSGESEEIIASANEEETDDAIIENEPEEKSEEVLENVAEDDSETLS